MRIVGSFQYNALAGNKPLLKALQDEIIDILCNRRKGKLLCSHEIESIIRNEKAIEAIRYAKRNNARQWTSASIVGSVAANMAEKGLFKQSKKMSPISNKEEEAWNCNKV